MRILLLGAGGMLARDVADTAPSDVEVIAKTRVELNVTDERAVEEAVRKHEPSVIVNCAAYTNVDRAESEREIAFAVNATAPGIIGRASVRNPQSAIDNPLIVHFSTDYVFNGQSDHPYLEDHATDPVNAYGASKLGGERALADSGARHVIVRTSWLFGVHGKSFPRTMWQRATEGKATKVVNDQVGRPTYTVDLARAVWSVITGTTVHGSQLTGHTIHVANSGHATWYDVSARVFEAAGRPELLTPCATAQYPTPAPRPAYSALDTSRFDERFGALPSWSNGLARFLAEVGTTPHSPLPK